MSPLIHLHLCLGPGLISIYSGLMQRGIMLKTRIGFNVKTLLVEQLGLSEGYIEERIQTIFLDGHAVDDLETATLKEGSTLALSAAMPGLAGATLRRKGALSSLRSQITHRQAKGPTRQQEGMVVLKLFNLLVEELGPNLLKKGVYIGAEDLRDFLKTLPHEFWNGCIGARLNGQPLDRDELLGMKWLGPDGLVELRVDFEDS